jgi:aldose 1-epimerase
VATASGQDGIGATLSYVSPDGDQNFPGTLTTRVTYALTNDNALRIEYVASTDKDTVINLTNHSYFNLAGNGSGSVADQLLLINADRYTPIGPDLIPTGEIAAVGGTPLDFRQMLPIGARLNSAFQQMVYAHGYDHNFVLNQRAGEAMTFAARAYDPHTGRVIDCLTTEPAVQIYTSNGMNGSVVGSSGTTYRQTEAFTLETQHFPDSPNKRNFPTTELKPGQEFHSTTVLRFATDTPLPPLPR